MNKETIIHQAEQVQRDKEKSMGYEKSKQAGLAYLHWHLYRQRSSGQGIAQRFVKE